MRDPHPTQRITSPAGINLKSLAHELLHEAQQSLQDEGHLSPTAVVITPKENLIFDIEYETEEDREETYSQMIEVAREKNAMAIITVNDVYLDSSGSLATLDGAGWGVLSESAREAILVVVSGGGFETWTLTAPYFHRGGQIVFQPAQENHDPGAEVELLGDWTGRTGAA
jgi:hypothetical protein